METPIVWVAARAAAPRTTNCAGSLGAGGCCWIPGMYGEPPEYTVRSGVPVGRSNPLLGDPMIRGARGRGVVPASCCAVKAGYCSKVTVAVLTGCGPEDEGSVPGVMLSSWAEVPGWLTERGVVGLTKIPSEPRTQPLGGLSVGGKKCMAGLHFPSGQDSQV